MKAGRDRHIAQQMIVGVVEIGDRDRLACCRGLAERAEVLVDGEVLALDGAVDADRLRQIELMLRGIIAVNQHRVGVGDFERARRDRRQHGVEIERGSHRAADLLEHFELVDRAREVAGACLDLGFKADIRLLQLARHAVELVGQFLQLVGGMDVDALAEIAGAEPPRAGAQCRDRNQHAARQQRAGEDRDQKPERDQKCYPPQLIADRRQRQRGRLLVEHQPAEFRNGVGCGQHRLAAGVGAGSLRLAVRLDQCGDLRQRGHIPGHLGALGGARQHLAALVDHIGGRDLADLGIAEEIRQETQIDFGDGDTGVDARMRQRDRHIGPAFPEIGRGQVDAPADAFDKSNIAGKILAAVHRNRAAGQAKQLLAAPAQPGELADRRHLVQQLGKVGAVLVHRVGAGAGHPAHLALEVGDRLLDPPRGRLRLLAHGVGQRGLGGAVADPGFERAVDREHEHHQADQGDDVFGEQAPAPRPNFIRDPDHPDPRGRHPRRARASAKPCQLGQFSTLRGGSGGGLCQRG